MNAQKMKVVKSFLLGFGSFTRHPTPTHYKTVQTGDTLRYDSTAPNGNVWFIFNGERGKIEAGSIENMIKRRLVEKLTQ